MSVRDLKGNGRWWALAGCLLWLAFTFFPLYWVTITSFKSPLGVVGGPTYLPFVDFEPTLTAWTELLSGQRGQFYNNFMASTIIGLSASVIATAVGSMAAYALVRFTFEVKLLTGVNIRRGGFRWIPARTTRCGFWTSNIAHLCLCRSPRSRDRLQPDTAPRSRSR